MNTIPNSQSRFPSPASAEAAGAPGSGPTVGIDPAAASGSGSQAMARARARNPARADAPAPPPRASGASKEQASSFAFGGTRTLLSRESAAKLTAAFDAESMTRRPRGNLIFQAIANAAPPPRYETSSRFVSSTVLQNLPAEAAAHLPEIKELLNISAVPDPELLPPMQGRQRALCEAIGSRLVEVVGMVKELQGMYVRLPLKPVDRFGPELLSTLKRVLEEERQKTASGELGMPAHEAAGEPSGETSSKTPVQAGAVAATGASTEAPAQALAEASAGASAGARIEAPARTSPDPSTDTSVEASDAQSEQQRDGEPSDAPNLFALPAALVGQIVGKLTPGTADSAVLPQLSKQTRGAYTNLTRLDKQLATLRAQQRPPARPAGWLNMPTIPFPPGFVPVNPPPDAD